MAEKVISKRAFYSSQQGSWVKSQKIVQKDFFIEKWALFPFPPTCKFVYLKLLFTLSDCRETDMQSN